MDKLLALRKQLNESSDQKLTITDFIIKAVAKACKEVPETNSQFQTDKLFQFNDVDVSVAVDIGNGLITPIVTKSDSKTIGNVSADLKDLVKRAKDGQL